MNVHQPSTGASAPATPVNWDEVIDGRGGLHDLATQLKHLLHFLDADLEFAFDPQRARRSYPAGFDLSFTPESVDATKWLAGRAWSVASDLVEKIETVQLQLDEARS